MSSGRSALPRCAAVIRGVVASCVGHLGRDDGQADTAVVRAGHVDDVLVLIGQSLHVNRISVDLEPAWRILPCEQRVRRSFDSVQSDGENLRQRGQLRGEVTGSRPPGAVDVAVPVGPQPSALRVLDTLPHTERPHDRLGEAEVRPEHAEKQVVLYL